MKSSLTADGPQRFQASVEYQAHRRELEEMVHAKYAFRLAQASFFWRLIIRYQRYRELRCELAKITPSPHSLWLSNVGNR